MRRPRTPRWSSRLSTSDLKATRTLIRDIWLIQDELAWHQIKSYQEHIRECRKGKDDNSIPCEKVADIVALIHEINLSGPLTINETEEKVRKLCPLNQQTPHKESVHQALYFAIRLWLFVPLYSKLQDGAGTLKDLVSDKLNEDLGSGPNRILKDDFCEKSLTRKAGIKIRWTSDLTRHLELQGNRLFVFRHGAALKAYADDTEM